MPTLAMVKALRVRDDGCPGGDEFPWDTERFSRGEFLCVERETPLSNEAVIGLGFVLEKV